jgi:hypothetical protein
MTGIDNPFDIPAEGSTPFSSPESRRWRQEEETRRKGLEDAPDSREQEERRSSTFGPNLRGTGREQTTQTGGIGSNTPINVNVVQEIRFPAFNSVPETFEEYPGWRFILNGDILGISGVDILILKRFLASIEQHTESELGSMEFESELYERLDGKLYTAVQKALQKSSKQKENLLALQVDAVFSRGRQAVKWLDRKNRFDIMKLASKAQRVEIQCFHFDGSETAAEPYREE